jgi:hypothetical protein
VVTQNVAHEGFLEIVDQFERDAKEAVSVLASLFRLLVKSSEKITPMNPGKDQTRS